jgi:hypothetical protein
MFIYLYNNIYQYKNYDIDNYIFLFLNAKYLIHYLLKFIINLILNLLIFKINNLFHKYQFNLY